MKLDVLELADTELGRLFPFVKTGKPDNNVKLCRAQIHVV